MENNVNDEYVNLLKIISGNKDEWCHSIMNEYMADALVLFQRIFAGFNSITLQYEKSLFSIDELKKHIVRKNNIINNIELEQKKLSCEFAKYVTENEVLVNFLSTASKRKNRAALKSWINLKNERIENTNLKNKIKILNQRIDSEKEFTYDELLAEGKRLVHANIEQGKQIDTLVSQNTVFRNDLLKKESEYNKTLDIYNATVYDLNSAINDIKGKNQELENCKLSIKDLSVTCKVANSNAEELENEILKFKKLNPETFLQKDQKIAKLCDKVEFFEGKIRTLVKGLEESPLYYILKFGDTIIDSDEFYHEDGDWKKTGIKGSVFNTGHAIHRRLYEVK